MVRPAGAKPKKPNPEFPLFAHAGGTWAKKIDGAHKHFGPWSDPAGAYNAYVNFTNAARYGRAPAPKIDGSITVDDLTDHFMARQHERIKSGEISPRTFRDMFEVIPKFLKAIGADIAVSSLAPADFTHFRKQIAHLGQHATNRHIRVVRQMLRWGFESHLFPDSVRYGDTMRKVSDKARQRVGEKAPSQMFTGAEIQQLIGAAKGAMKAMVLLGINCGLGNTDCGALQLSMIDFKAKVLNFPRPKTGIQRRCPLWKETIDAIREYQAIRPAPTEGDTPLLFITRYGRAFVREETVEERGVVQGVQISDAVAGLFNKLMIGAKLWKVESGKVKRDGRSFYSLRHTFNTWADEVKDAHAVERIMGHAMPGMSAHYIEEISDHRLRSVTDHVHDVLFMRSRKKRL